MIWLNPAALIALVVVAAPIAIHILVRRRAEHFAFPTLRFLQPTRLAAIRRHLLEDVLLLVVRAAVLAAVVAALARPLMVTAARRQLWQQRIARATVVDTRAAEGARASQASGALSGDRPFRSQTFATSSLSDGLRRAVAWLESAPPARRELAIVSAFAIGSLTAADLARVPADVGIRFERRGSLPSTRTITLGRLLTTSGAVDREMVFAGTGTIARDVPRPPGAAQPAAWPIEVLASPVSQPAADAAFTAVLAQHVWAPAPGRAARLMLLDAGALPTGSQVAETFRSAIADARPIRAPWMADAIARITRDADLQSAARRVAQGAADPRFSSAPWQRVADADAGQPLAVAAASGERLIVVDAAPASSVVTPLLMRAMANALAAPPDLQRAEVVPIPDEALRLWSRPAVPLPAPRVQTIDEDDRRWLWLTVLVLLALEAWMRRGRRDAANDNVSRGDAWSARKGKAARVA